MNIYYRKPKKGGEIIKTQTWEDFIICFEDWYKNNFKIMVNYINFYIQNYEISEDLSSNICEKALQKHFQYNPDKGTLSNWIYGIARNSIKIYFRENERESFFLNSMFTAETNQIRHTEKSLELSIEKKELLNQIINNINTMTILEQRIIEYRYGSNYSYNEIASKLNINISQVGVVLHRVHKKLKARSNFNIDFKNN